MSASRWNRIFQRYGGIYEGSFMLLRSSYPRRRLWLRFSFIELMIGLAMIGILSSMVVGLFGGPSVIYGYFKSKDVSGQLESVASAMPAGSLVGAVPGTPVFQASVLIKRDDGTLVTFSTDDRQWAAFVGEAAKGKCATARIYPYAPWEFGKAGTYFNGRLLSVTECGDKAS